MFKLLKIVVLAIILQAPTAFVNSDLIEFARNICNATKEEITGRVVGGVNAPGIIKYQLLIDPKHPLYQLCGAAPINEHYAITAAHCVVHNDTILPQVDIFGGVYEFPIKSDRKELQIREAKKSNGQIIVHPGYDSTNHSHDIAILKVSKPFDFNDGKVEPVKLPTKSTPLDGDAVISGWGCSLFDQKQCKPSKVLKTAKVPLWSLDNCTIAWTKADASGNESQEQPERMKEGLAKMVCAGGKHVGSCNGDSGGPLVVKENGSSVIIGITSYGFRFMCGCDGVPAAYTNVISFLDWIKEKIDDKENHGSGHAALKDLSSNLVYIIWLFMQRIIN